VCAPVFAPWLKVAHPQLPLDPKNLARLREVRENLDAALGFAAAGGGN
jgi:hypothetical protein